MVYFTVVCLEGRRLRAAGGVEALAAVGAGMRNKIAKISSWKDRHIPWELMVLMDLMGFLGFCSWDLMGSSGSHGIWD